MAILPNMKSRRIILIALLALLVCSVGGYFLLRQTGVIHRTPKVITDSVALPQTQKFTGGEGKFIEGSAGVPVALMPDDPGEEVIVVGAELAIKGAYEVALAEAKKWAPDAKLLFAQTLGTITLDGKTSYWQIGFASAQKRKGYEIIVQGSSAISAKEVVSAAEGFDLPKNWYDSNEALSSMRSLPQFSDATVSKISFFYDTEARSWMYSILTSVGASAMPVR